MQVPIYVTLKSFYRTLIDVPDSATEKEVRQKAWDMILEGPDDILEQVDIGIEEEDIIRLDVDLDDAIKD